MCREAYPIFLYDMLWFIVVRDWEIIANFVL